MVKAVIGEESRLQLAEDRLSQSPIFVQVGLVIGNLSSRLDRGFVFDLVPTQPNDAGEPPCSIVDAGGKDDKKKGSKFAKSSNDSSSSLLIHRDWVAEHARQGLEADSSYLLDEKGERLSPWVAVGCFMMGTSMTFF